MIALLLLAHTLLAQAPARPVLIRGALVVDGSGSPARSADVRIVGMTIRQIGKLTPGPGDSVVDARGLVLAPGFIDTHSHHDRGLDSDPGALAVVSQGVTTIVVGQDGWSSFPLADWFARRERRPAAVNVASYVGHGRLRDMVMGMDFKRPATSAEIRHMAALLDGEMGAGALGLSSGLEYDPGIYSATDELVALARVAARHGGRYISHIRSEDRHFWAAVDELIAIGRQTGIPVQLSHAKLAMRPVWGRADSLIGVLDRARASGVHVTLDIYPYTYWQSTLTVLFPERNFQDTAEARFALTEVTTPDSAILGDFEPDTSLAGKSIAEIAALRGTDPAVTLMDLIAEAGKPKPDGGSYDESVVAVSMVQPDIDRLWRWPFANVCSDGSLAGAHPRGFGAFPRFFRMAVRERRVLSLEEAVRRATSLAAENVGISSRGRIAPGFYADLVLLDTLALTDRATPKQPHLTSSGVRAVWVNGSLVFNGAVTGALPGRVIRRR
ncbi:MAG TPA: D-aminoacylase [Gemmatimonadales bacterium]|nr:D-aminoacylase [Gemmatimonadales bacterium]